MSWTYFNETYHSYSLPDPHDTDGIFKVMGSKVKVTDDILKCTFPVEALIDSSSSKTTQFINDLSPERHSTTSHFF